MPRPTAARPEQPSDVFLKWSRQKQQIALDARKQKHTTGSENKVRAQNCTELRQSKVVDHRIHVQARNDPAIGAKISAMYEYRCEGLQLDID
jgi:hypothetical protein